MSRDWKSVNNRLIQQGTLLISLDFLDNWNKQVKKLNQDKVGRPFEYPDGLIQYSGLLHCYMGLGYRQVQGVLIAIEKKEPRMKVAVYSQLCRRFNKLETKIQPRRGTPDEDLWIAVDVTGICVTNRGEWLRKIHRKGKIDECKGFLKVHVAVDVKTKEVVAIEVTREDVGDNSKFDDLLEGSIMNTGRKIGGVYADGAYDTYENFEKLDDLGIYPAIRIDDNAITDPPPPRFPQRRRKLPARTVYAQEQLADRKKWKEKTGYGKRWHAEGYFSVDKRRFGQYVRARKMENMQHEMCFRAQLYNQLFA